LTELGFVAIYLDNALAATDLLKKRSFDVIVSDIMMPSMNGHQFIEQLRSNGIETPVLFLTALGSTDDKVAGFELGADDYLTKPFEFRELVARVRVLAKRKALVHESDILICEDLQIDLGKKKVVRGDAEIQLTQREYDLLVYFMTNQDRIISKPELVEKVWGLNFDPGTNVIEVYVNYLRNKINKGQGNRLIENIHGQGYRLKGKYADQS
jgi:two-component system copper resistance phosphate regulon response regulator CusR